MDVQIEGLRFRRDGRVVVDIASLVLRKGRTTAILGPNGAGKTTLLRLIAGLEIPGEGRIAVGGTVVRRDIRTRHDVAYVFQERVFLRQSVRNNLELGLKLRGVPKAERTARVDEAAHLLGISHLLERTADRMSEGEGRRASLARALCLKAPLALLDEPLAGLDPPTYARLRDDLPHLLGALGATTVLVTHDREEALRLGDDLVVLVDGRVRSAGGKRDVVLNPAGPEVAGLLGYAVVRANGRRVAIPPGAFHLGPGSMEFLMAVEARLDLVDRLELLGRIDDVRVHVVVAAGVEPPQPGDRVVVHAERAVRMD
jgi:ABC-type sugar transport system ATPase subunit